MKYQNGNLCATPSLSSTKKPGPPTKPKPKRNNNNDAESKEPVQVFCRLRPLKNPLDTVVVRKIGDKLLEISPPNGSKQLYKFQYVFDDRADQHEVFERSALPLVEDLIQGRNGLIFTYGITSSGKTHTITGNPMEPGILPRTLDTIFNTLDKNALQSTRYVFKPDGQNGFEIIPTPDAILKQQREIGAAAAAAAGNRLKTLMGRVGGGTGSPKGSPTKKRDLGQLEWDNRVRMDTFVKNINCDNNYAVFVSYVELYNNYVYDLLDDSFDTLNAKGDSAPRPKRVIEDAQKKCYVQGVKEIEVKSSNEAFDLCLKGMKRRRMGITLLNSESSRSHSVFNIRLVQAPLDRDGVEMLENREYIKIGQLSVVDLAGCERTGRTKATGDRLKEASNINNSLMSLRNCFDVLRENQKCGTNKMVPYRDNKLTQLFKNYFEGDGKVEMIICINPGLEDCNETLQVCKFAELSQDLTTNKMSAFQRFPLRTPVKESGLIITGTISLNSVLGDKYLEDPYDDQTLPDLIKSLRRHKDNLNQYQRQSQQNQLTVRGNVSGVERELTLLRNDNSLLKMDLEARESQLREYEERFNRMELKMQQYELEIQDLRDQNESLQDQVQQMERANEKIQNKYYGFKRKALESWQAECERMKEHFKMALKKREIELEMKYRDDREKLELIKKLSSGDHEDIEFIRPTWMVMSPPRPTGSKTPVSMATKEGPVTVAHSRPIANPRYRRSLSTDDVKWIDHRPPGTLQLGTVFQPNIPSKKRKSVTNLKAADFIKKDGGSKYALTHHQATEDGAGVQTHVFKADVVPSACGGAQIIFNDVETLVQSPPEGFLYPRGGVTTRRKRVAAELMTGNQADQVSATPPSTSSSGGAGTSSEPPCSSTSTTPRKTRRIDLLAGTGMPRSSKK